MAQPIPIPRFQRDIEREALERHIAARVRDLAAVSTPEQFSLFWASLSHSTLATGKRLPGSRARKPDDREFLS